MNAFIQYRGYDAFDLTLGRFKEPFGMEALTSALWTPTIERSSITNKPNPVSAGLFIDSGVMLSKRKNNYTWAIAAVNDKTEDENSKELLGLTGRATIAPINSALKTLHFVLAHAYRSVSDGTEFVLDEPLSVATGNKTEFYNGTLNRLNQTGLEIAYKQTRSNLL